MAWLKIRRVARELEARLTAPDGESAGRAKGKAERKWYSNGTERLKVRVRGLDFPDGHAVTLSIGNQPVAQLAVNAGTLEFELESDVPDATLGDILTIADGAAVLVSGSFVAD